MISIHRRCRLYRKTLPSKQPTEKLTLCCIVLVEDLLAKYQVSSDDLRSREIWRIGVLRRISVCTCLFSTLLEIVPSGPILISITVTSLFQYTIVTLQGPCMYLAVGVPWFLICDLRKLRSRVVDTIFSSGYLLLIIWTILGILNFAPKPCKNWCVLSFKEYSVFSLVYLLVYTKFSHLHNSQGITFLLCQFATFPYYVVE